MVPAVAQCQHRGGDSSHACGGIAADWTHLQASPYCCTSSSISSILMYNPAGCITRAASIGRLCALECRQVPAEVPDGGVEAPPVQVAAW